MLVSIITPVLNGRATIASAIESVLGQSYHNIEYIIVDNGSTDGTVDIVNRYKDRIGKLIGEARRGIYTTMDRGIRSASGDIVGVLNSDDFYADGDVIKTVVEKMNGEGADACWGDLVYVDREDPDRIIRYWRSCAYRDNLFKSGWMPPHPTFFVRKRVYEKYGYFNTDLKIAADYELMLRFLHRHKVSCCYIPGVLVKMRMGGLSNRGIRNIVIKTAEDLRAWRLNGLPGGASTIFMKNISKIPQFFVRQEIP